MAVSKQDMNPVELLTDSISTIELNVKSCEKQITFLEGELTKERTRLESLKNDERVYNSALKLLSSEK